MFRKIALAAAAVVTLGAGLAATPADARPYHGGHGGGHHRGGGFYAPLGFGFGFGSGYGYGGGYGYAPRYYAPPRRYCEEVVVRRKINGKWRRVVQEQCYRGRRYY